MKPLFKSSTFTAYFSNKTHGNVDIRFSDNALQNRDTLLAELGIAQTAWMKAQGESDYEDLTKIKTLPAWSEYKVDALLSRISSGTGLALYPADCIPLVVSAPKQDIVALIHVGRRNAEAGIIARVFKHLQEVHNISPTDTEVFVGPSVRQSSYFFEHIDSKQQNDKSWEKHIERKGGNYYIDLLGFTLDRLIEVGVKRSSVTINYIDTGSDSNYFSHARSARTGEAEGRNMFIVKPGTQ